jgi:hypothetical protein
MVPKTKAQTNILNDQPMRNAQGINDNTIEAVKEAVAIQKATQL